ncbi:MAG: hypothetical protein ACRD1K_10890 [Acidimicrobiales bacterium]
MSLARRRCPSVLLLAAAIVVPACGGADAPAGAPLVPLGTAPASTEPARGLIFFLPRELPGDLEVRIASTSPGAPEQQGGTAVVIGRPSGDEFVDVVRALVADAVADRDIGPDEEALIRRVELNGRMVRLIDNEGTHTTAVEWFEGGRAIAVFGPAGRSDLVLEVAGALDLDRRGPDLLPSLPAGYVRLGSTTVGAGAAPNWTMVLTSSSATAAPWSVNLDGSYVAGGADPVSLLGGSGPISAVTVRGAVGLASTTASRPAAGGPGTIITTLAWRERPDLAIVMRGTADRAALVALAETLAEVDEATFTAAGTLRVASPAPPTSRP